MKRIAAALSVGTTVLFVSSVYLSGQGPAAPGPAAAARATAPVSAIPRTADGKPDMQGYWTNQTFTPLERSAALKGQEFFTAEEAAAVAKRGLDRIANQAEDAIHYDDAIWMLEGYPKGAMLRTSIVVDPPDGRIPAMTPEGQQRAQARAAARKLVGQFDSAQTRSLSERCIYWAHEGPPLLPTGYNSNLQIVQAPGTFVVTPEMMPVSRVVPLDNRPRLGAAIRSYRGDPRGRWEGDTMVIETTNYSEKTAWRGSSENLKVTERFTLVNPDTIRYQFTVEDAATWTRPWSGEYEMQRIKGPLFEYACHEGNYGIATILRAARLEEAGNSGR